MKKARVSNVTLTVIFIMGMLLLLYPSVSNYWNSMHQSTAIANYVQNIGNIDSVDYALIIQNAKDFNGCIRDREIIYKLTDDEKACYENLLNISDNGVMGYIEIPAIDVSLPIYHGTSANVLQKGAGHMDWTSLPVGGKSTHCVISGHRGLPSAKLFSNLDKLVAGDVFMIRVLDEILTYEVDQILIVDPKDTENLRIEEGMDYCTLLTCTPYGINTHRLLVRGHRIENEHYAQTINITAEAIQIEPALVSALIDIPVLIVIMLMIFLIEDRKNVQSAEDV